MEKEYLTHQYQDLLERFAELQKKNENLIVDNEKLKNDNRNKRFLNKSQTLSGKNRSFIFGKFVNTKEKSVIMDDSKSTLTNMEKENSNKKNFMMTRKF